MKRLALLLLTACGGTSQKPVDPVVCPEVAQVGARFDERLALATGDWVANDCDGFLWNSKLYAVAGAPPWSVELAEREPGRFDRRPIVCWEDGVDLGAQTTWSRDMGRGLIVYAWRTGRLDILERHLAYGQAHDWVMGFPLADGRTVYSPALRGALAQTVYALGGTDSAERRWPDLYPAGLVDYEAHLQVLSILHRGEVEQRLREGDARPAGPIIIDDPGDAMPLVLDISPDMRERLAEHAAREPYNALFQATLGRYTGDMGPAAKALLADPWFRPSYTRCADQAVCDEIEWLFAADVYLRACRRIP